MQTMNPLSRFVDPGRGPQAYTLRAQSIQRNGRGEWLNGFAAADLSCE